MGACHQGVVVSLVERASKFTILERVASRTAGEVGSAIRTRLKPHGKRVHTMTSDNGKEFASHAEVSVALGAGFFFAKPYHWWERGLNEPTNGLVRQYLTKTTHLREINARDLARVEGLLNDRLRKVLGYRTPAEVFARALAAAAP